MLLNDIWMYVLTQCYCAQAPLQRYTQPSQLSVCFLYKNTFPFDATILHIAAHTHRGAHILMHNSCWCGVVCEHVPAQRRSWTWLRSWRAQARCSCACSGHLVIPCVQSFDGQHTHAHTHTRTHTLWHESCVECCVYLVGKINVLWAGPRFSIGKLVNWFPPDLVNHLCSLPGN